MSKVLIINGHPNEPASFANAIILKEVHEKLPDAEIRNLSEVVTDKGFDIEAEQQKLREADIIVWQFPMFWYSVPALLKQYLDDVYTHGFAYGSEGTALRGKKFIASTTTGAPAEVYTHDGFVGSSIEDLLHPLEATCKLCGIEYLPPVHSSAMNIMVFQGQGEEITARAKDHAARLVEAIKKAE